MSHPPFAQPIRPADQTGGEEAVETTIDPPAAARGPGPRRQAPRFAPKPGVRVEVRPWGGGAGQDVALELLELSELNIRVRLRLPVWVSSRFQVTLRDPEGQRWARMMATLSWSAASEDGTFVAVLELGTFLTPDIVRRLGASPVPAPAPAGQS